MAYETSLLFNLLAQKRARNAQAKQESQGYQQQMMRDVGAFRDKQAAEEEAQVGQAAQLGSLYQDAGEVMPDFNPSFSPQMEGRLKEAAQMGSLAQIGARLKAKRAAEAELAAEKARQGYITDRERGIADLTGEWREKTALGDRETDIEVAKIHAGRPFAPRGGGAAPDPAKYELDATSAKYWTDLAKASPQSLATAPYMGAMQAVAMEYLRAQHAPSAELAAAHRAAADRMAEALNQKIRYSAAAAMSSAAQGGTP